MCIHTALNGGHAWWVAPTYKMADEGWRLLQRLCKQIPGVKIHKGNRHIYFPNNGLIQARSADNPDSLRGAGLDFVALEEFAFMDEQAWSVALRPALTDKQGRAIFISTPNGFNHFYKLFKRGLSDKYPDWMSWRFPSTSNPLVTEKELEEARRSMPAKKFRQEFMAEFVDAGGSVFKLEEALHSEWQHEPKENHQYVIGIDWAQSDDFTALVVIDVTTMRMVYAERMNALSFTEQLERVKQLLDIWKPELVVSEQNSIGAALNDQLIRDGYPIQPQFVNWSNKPKFITNLALLLENGTLKILDEPEIVEEFNSYTATTTSSAITRVVYKAPQGQHDDFVMATALAASAIYVTSVEEGVDLW